MDIRVAQRSITTAARAIRPVESPGGLLPASLAAQGLVLAVVLVLLVLSCGLPRFASMTISEACAASSPSSGDPLFLLDFHLYRGVGSDATCSSRANSFCIAWTQLATWSRIDAIAGEGSHMQYDAQYGWPATQVLVPLAAGAVLVAGMVAATIGYSVHHKRSSWEALYSLLMMVSSLTLLAWVLSFSGLNSVVYSSTLSSDAWTNFFRAGYSLKDVVEGSTASAVPDPKGNSCIAIVRLSEGGILLSVATALSFVTSIAMCCLRCFAR